MPAFFNPDKSISYLRSIAMGNNNTTSTFDKFYNTQQASSRICKLLTDVSFFILPGDRITTQCNDDCFLLGHICSTARIILRSSYPEIVSR